MKHPEKIAFIGIGGAGMTPLAQFFLEQGMVVVGYDRVRSQNVHQLEELGAVVHVADVLDHTFDLSDVDRMIYSAAFTLEHPVLRAFSITGKPIRKRSQELGYLSTQFPTLAIAGTHGKTTTSAILAHILDQHQGVLAFIGGRVESFQGNYRHTGDAWMVAEADEFDRALLELSPKTAVVTNVEADHLDVYASFEDLEETIATFTQKAEWVLVHESLKGKPGFQEARFFGVQDGVSFQLCSIIPQQNMLEVVFARNGQEWLRFSWKILGEHNALNALAAAAVAFDAGVPDVNIISGLESFAGVRRRMEVWHWNADFVCIDDYAHHPTEITCLYHAIQKQFSDREVLCVFQPHLFSRTRDFLEAFAEALSLFTSVVLLPIYPAREMPIAGVSSQAIAERMTGEVVVVEKEVLMATIKEKLAPPQVILTVGASDIDQYCEPIKELLNAY